jgi:hypothetical protein
VKLESKSLIDIQVVLYNYMETLRERINVLLERFKLSFGACYLLHAGPSKKFTNHHADCLSCLFRYRCEIARPDVISIRVS